MAKEETDGITNGEYEQLMQHLYDGAEAALASNSRTEMREFIEEVSDLCNPDTDLNFNPDGSVEVAEDDADDQETDDE